jgi:hypothetical protein
MPEFLKNALRFLVYLCVSLNPVLADFPVPELVHPSLSDPAKAFENHIKAPALWGVELIGADLSKSLLRPIHLEPVTVVISDGGVQKGVIRHILYQKLSRSCRFPLTSKMGLDKYIPLDTLDEIYRRDWKDLVCEHLPDFANLIWGQSSPGHGDHVAGILGAESTLFGVSESARIEEIDVFHGLGRATTNSLLGAIAELTESSSSVSVLNMSHGLGTHPQVRTALDSLIDAKDTVCVASADNHGVLIQRDWVIHHLPRCLIVGSLSKLGIPSHFSNFGNELSLVAPGEDILSFGEGSLWNGVNTRAANGTSMATPMVSGTAASLRALLPFANEKQIREILVRTAIDIGPLDKDERTGNGILNSLKAVEVAKRLRESGVRDEKALREKFLDPKTFELSDVAEATYEAALREREDSPEYLRLLRKAALEDGRAENFLALGRAYERLGLSDYGLGLQIIALNRPKAHLQSEDLLKILPRLARLQEESAHLQHPNFHVIRSIGNAELLMALFNHLSASTALIAGQAAMEQMRLIAPNQMNEFSEMRRQKLFASSNDGRVAILKTAK